MTASIESEMRSNGSDQSSSDLFLSSVSTRKLPLDCLFPSLLTVVAPMSERDQRQNLWIVLVLLAFG